MSWSVSDAEGGVPPEQNIDEWKIYKLIKQCCFFANTSENEDITCVYGLFWWQLITDFEIWWHLCLPFVGHAAEKTMVNGDGSHGHTEEAESKQDGNSVAEAGEESNDQEVIVIQDTGFTVKIQAPGTEPFDLQVNTAA